MDDLSKNKKTFLLLSFFITISYVVFILLNYFFNYYYIDYQNYNVDLSKQILVLRSFYIF